MEQFLTPVCKTRFVISVLCLSPAPITIVLQSVQSEVHHSYISFNMDYCVLIPSSCADLNSDFTFTAIII
jgi:hypothetical protein